MADTIRSVRRARIDLIAAIRNEIASTLGNLRSFPLPKHSIIVARREAAIRALIRAVRQKTSDAR